MIELVLSVCFIAQPANCKDVSLSFVADNMTPYQCMLSGQSAIVRWQEGHPGWRISRWTCARPVRTAKG